MLISLKSNNSSKSNITIKSNSRNSSRVSSRSRLKSMKRFLLTLPCQKRSPWCVDLPVFLWTRKICRALCQRNMWPRSPDQWLLITSAKEVMFLPEFVCLCVSKITQKVMEGSFWNFQGMLGMAKITSDSILGVIRKESWISDDFEIFVNIALNGEYAWRRSALSECFSSFLLWKLAHCLFCPASFFMD